MLHYSRARFIVQIKFRKYDDEVNLKKKRNYCNEICLLPFSQGENLDSANVNILTFSIIFNPVEEINKSTCITNLKF